jgi:hypothetical protein
MSKIKIPQQKKRLSYKKDFINDRSESVQGFRKTWPRKKAYANQAHRHEVRQLLHTVEGIAVSDAAAEEIHPLSVRRKQLRKWQPLPLGEVVKLRLSDRFRTTGYNFFKVGYNSKLHQKRFSQFLATLIQGHSDQSKQHSLVFKRLMESDSQQIEKDGGQLQQRRAWLASFFKDEPNWKAHLQTWIASFE